MVEGAGPMVALGPRPPSSVFFYCLGSSFFSNNIYIYYYLLFFKGVLGVGVTYIDKI